MKIALMTIVMMVGGAGIAAPLKVWCSIPPLKSIAKNVGGDRVEVTCFMTGSQDPHTFSPTPKTVARAQDADLFLTVGMPFEMAVQKKVSALNTSMNTLDLAVTVEKNGDPHVWLSLPLLSQMAETLEQELVRIDPEGQTVYRQNLTRYQARLTEQHEALKKRTAPLRGTVFYVFHPAFGHFAADYGLQQQAVELDGKSPTPKQLLALIQRAREENVRIVFVQPQFDRRPATMIADRIGGRVVELNQLDEDPESVIQAAVEEIERAVSNP
jgi:zinc transport system substrate-binding protein